MNYIRGTTNYRRKRSKKITDSAKKPCSWIGRINTVKMAIVPKAFYMLITNPNKIPVTFITQT
jgi:hypothetical protein